MLEIIPAILTQDEEELDEKINLIEGRTAWVHFDVVAGTPLVHHFDVGTNFEVHFMLDEPEAALDRWLDAGADRIVVHNLTENILSHRPMVEIGLAVRIDVSIESIIPMLGAVDFVQLMAIAEIGQQGRQLESVIFDRIKELKELYPGVIISIDGGVNLENADELFEAGADRLIVGSAIMGALDPLDALADFQAIARNNAIIGRKET
jgi:ribulose-phosphate 3-epimerase